MDAIIDFLDGVVLGIGAVLILAGLATIIYGVAGIVELAFRR